MIETDEAKRLEIQRLEKRIRRRAWGLLLITYLLGICGIIMVPTFIAIIPRLFPQSRAYIMSGITAYNALGFIMYYGAWFGWVAKMNARQKGDENMLREHKQELKMQYPAKN